jgi:hypothetical protein
MNSGGGRMIDFGRELDGFERVHCLGERSPHGDRS